MTTLEILGVWKLVELVIWVSPYIARLSGQA